MSVEFPDIRQDKGEVIPVQACCRCTGYQELETLRFQESAHEDGKVFSPMHRLSLPRPPPKKYSW
jgi:hypothetical protein